MRREFPTGAELRNRAAIDVDQGTAGVSILTKLSKASRGITKSTYEPQPIARLSPDAMGNRDAGPGDGGEAKDARRPLWQRDGVAADKRKSITFARSLDT